MSWTRNLTTIALQLAIKKVEAERNLFEVNQVLPSLISVLLLRTIFDFEL
jgi:hypothetical protein